MSEPELPRYRCHKVVSALEIAVIDGNELVFLDPGYAPRTVDPQIMLRYRPIPGDYFVVYEDGYQSISPKEPFEDGYTRIEE